MHRWAVVLITGFLLASCKEAQSDISAGKQGRGTASEDAGRVVDTGEAIERTADVLHASEPSTGEFTFELQQTTSYVWSVLPPERVCVDEGARTGCIEVGEARYPASGSKFLDVSIEVENVGEQEASISAGELLVEYQGRSLRYHPMEGEQSVTVPALGAGNLRSTYEVPVRVLNEGSFRAAIADGKLVEISFVSPRDQELRREEARAKDAEAEVVEASLERERESVREKCWALNDSEAQVVSREEFSWYIEQCSHLFSVGDYETYLRSWGKE